MAYVADDYQRGYDDATVMIIGVLLDETVSKEEIRVGLLAALEEVGYFEQKRIVG